jgi:hypothetical protein
VNAYKVDDGISDPYKLTPEEFIHFKFYNPSNPWRGIAPITAVRMGIIIDQLAQAWTRLFFRNQARPDYAIIAPEGITETEKNEIENKLAVKFSGGDGIHKPIVLEQGITDIKAFSWAPKDLEWLEQRKLSRDEVGAIFGVPDEIMGYGRDTYENFGTADRVLWTLTIVPLVRLRDNALTRFARMRNILSDNERVETDLSGVPQLQEDKSGKIEQYSTLVNRGVPPNEASAFLGLGLPELPGGDIGYMPFSMVPIDTLGERESGYVGLSYDKAVKGPAYGSEAHAQILKRNDDRVEGPRKEMQRKLKRYFQEQMNRILAALRDQRTFGRGKYKDIEQIPSPEMLFNIESEVQQFIFIFGDVILEAVLLAASAELRMIEYDVLLNLDQPHVQAAIRQILETVARKTNETTWLNLIELFQEAEMEGEGIPSMQERLFNFFGERKSDWQTERIARTTMTGASSLGSQEAMRQAAKEHGLIAKKVWISALQPKRTRPEHAAAHDQTVGLDEMYMVGGEPLMHPGDPNGSPGNIINCLCTEVYELTGD